MKEIWKDIPNFENYQVSNLGRVKSKQRIIITKNSKKYPIKEKILKQQKNNKTGYAQHTLIKNKKMITKLTHLLVASAFMDKENNNLEINHKDENKMNNCVENLEYCNHKYNINYGTGNERRSISEKGKKKSGNYKNISHTGKKILQYDLQGNFIKEWNSIAEASKALKLNKIWEVCNNKRNKCGNFIWKYKKED